MSSAKRPSRRLPAVLLLLAAASTGSVRSVASDDVATRILDGVAHDRQSLGVPTLLRSAELDAVAAARAEQLAAITHAERLAGTAPIGEELERAGFTRFGRAFVHVDMVRGYERPEIGILASWRASESTWAEAMSAEFDTLGAATRRAVDGWIVFVAVLLEKLPSPPEARGLEDDVLAAVNRERVERGLGELVRSDALARVARAHSEDMLRRSYVSHVDPDGLGAAERIDLAGIRFRKVAENLHMSRGFGDPVAHAMRSWLHSQGHRGSMLDPEFTESAVGVAVGPDDTLYFTQLFLAPPRR